METCLVCLSKQKFYFFYRNFNYYKCDNCQLVSTYPLPTSKSIKEHYAKRFKKGNYETAYKYPQQYIAVYAEFVTILQKSLEKNNEVLKNKKILDIGCFTGDFLVLLQQKGADVYGLELQTDAVKIANKKLQGKVFQADVSSYRFPRKKYDVVTLLGVVEHVADPAVLLNYSYKLLNEGGIIMIQTPDSSSLLAKAMGKYWPPFEPVEHIHLFSRKSLLYALEKNGFHNISFQAHWKKLPVGYVYNNLNCFGRELRVVLDPFNFLLNNCSLMLPFFCGETIVLAKK